MYYLSRNHICQHLVRMDRELQQHCQYVIPQTCIAARASVRNLTFEGSIWGYEILHIIFFPLRCTFFTFVIIF
jgi:hypothetical protein